MKRTKRRTNARLSDSPRIPGVQLALGFALLAATMSGAADVPWEWNDALTARPAAAAANGTLTAFASKGPASVAVVGLSVFDSRIRTVCDYALSGFSNSPRGAVMVIR